MKISLLALNSQEFSFTISSYLGKGADHALKYYKNFFKKGDGWKGFNPKEPQSKKLFIAIDDLIKLPFYEIKRSLVSDSTEKYVLGFEDGHIAELVIIPMKTGNTLCISSQVGCKMACAFCETGRMGKLRDLSTEEIILQVFFAQNVLKKPIKNIVFMGMGEPFDNYEHVTKALDILIDIHGMGFPASNITVSTSGIVPRILDFIEYGKKGVKLALSVNGSNSENRTLVMPVNRKYSMDILKSAILEFTSKTGDKIFAEYVMMQNVNDSLENANELYEYLKDVPSIINLIPYNAQSHDRFQPPSDEVIKAFQECLKNLGAQVYVRQNKGSKIMAACGQLGQIDLKKRLLQKQ